MRTINNFRYRRIITFVIAAAAAAWINGSAFAQTEEVTRVKKWDVYLIGQNIHTEQIDYKTNSGLVPITVDTTFTGGIGFGNHFTEKFAWRFEGTVGDAVFRGHGPAEGTSRRATLSTGMVNFDWFISPRRISPYFTAGLGWQYLYTQTSNVGTTVAYWDPWYGYTVGTAYPTHTESNIVWSAGLGVRWEVTNSFFLRLSADANWINFSQASNNITQVRYGLALGTMY